MLPRHLRSASLNTARAATSHHPRPRVSLPRPSPIVSPSLSSRQFPSTRANFHTTARRLDELPKSPFQTFVDVLKDELQKNRDLQQNVKQLQGDVDKFQDSEAMKRARAAYERARVCSFPLSFYQHIYLRIHRTIFLFP